MTPTETRFALVFNGGVSLAVWMGGVTHELNRMRLASVEELARPIGEKEGPVHDAWRSILIETQRTAIIDVLAGTSAGGLNGTILAKAVASGADLPNMREVWSSVAALEPDKLLGKRTSASRRSLLDGQYFRDKVFNLLADMDKARDLTSSRDCTLLVTATAISTQPVEVQLEGTSTASQVDSRRVYRFERRTDDAGSVQDDFRPGLEALTLAARASASFPLAFEPVWETDQLKARRVNSADLENAWLIDGGVLDNAPFGPLLDALQARPVSADFERVVLYVTPSPGAGQVAALGEAPTARAVAGRVFGAAREPDQRLDLEMLREAFNQMGYTLSMPHVPLGAMLLENSPELTSQALLVAAENLFQTYRSTRTEAVERWMQGSDRKPRLAAASAPELDPQKVCTVPLTLSLPVEGEWRWGLATAERVLRWWGRLLVDTSRAGRDIPEDTWTNLNRAQRLVVRLWRELEIHMQTEGEESLLRRSGRLWDFYYGRGKSTEIRAALDDAAASIALLNPSQSISGKSLLELSLALEVVSSVLAWGWASEGDTVRFRYRQITPGVRSIVDIGEVADSPEWPAKKLYGERWAHFGAFASRRGREHDWVWGRLDGASAVFDFLTKSQDGTALLPPDREAHLRNQLAEAILQAEGMTKAQLKEDAGQALRLPPSALLDDMPREHRRMALEVLWYQVTSIVGDASTSDGLSATAMARAFADPTWTVRDNAEGLRWRDRFKLRLLRAYGWPARWLGKRQVGRALHL